MANILVVDDEAVDRELARRCLKPIDGLTIDYAATGQEALQQVSLRQPDLVLTDLRMPGMDGLELVRRLQDDFPLLPVVLMTSRGNEQIAVQALKAGAANYVPKKDLKQDLFETIRQVLEVAEAARRRSEVLNYLQDCETRFELVNDPGLIPPLVGYFQEHLKSLGFGNQAIRTQIGIALMEALSNAMIHGNLEVSSQLRQENRDEFDRLVQERQRLEPYSRRRVFCRARESNQAVEYVVRDQGPGFDPLALPDPRDSDNLLAVSGRGLMLIQTFMDHVRFDDRGSQITMTRRMPGQES